MLRQPLSLAALLWAATTPAIALDLDWYGATVRLDNTFSVGTAMRTSQRSADLVGLANGGNAYSTNGDDGNLAFDRGDLVSGASKLTSDLSVNYGDFGLFARGTGIYNPVLDRADYFDTADYGAGKEFGLDELERKTDSIQGAVGRDVELLDAYVHGRFEFADRSLSLRVGRQALNWGESLLIQNGLNSLLAFDANRLRVPGFQIEEVLRPAGMAWAALDVVPNISVEGFYQYEWKPTIIDAAGTFWSTNDFASIGGTQANLGFGRVNENTPAGTVSLPGAEGLACLPVVPVSPAQDCVPLGSTVPRLADVTPRDDDQYGGALHLFIPAFNDLSLSLFGANYHSRLPVLSGISRSSPAILPNQADTAGFQVEYPENIQLYGVSFNTTVQWLDIALQGEYSYKVGQPLQLDDVELLLSGLGAPSQINPVPGATLGNQYLRGWRRHDISLADLGFTRVFGPRFGYSQVALLGEVGLMHVHGMPDASVLAYEAPGTHTLNPGTAAMNPSIAANLPITPYDAYATSTSWGYRTAARVSYYNVFNLFTFEPTLVFQHDVSGVSPTPILNFIEGRKQATLLFGMDYQSAWSATLGYTNYFGAGTQNLLTDRDFVDLNIKYSF